MAGVPYNPLMRASAAQTERPKPNSIYEALQASARQATNDFNSSSFSQSMSNDVSAAANSIYAALMAPGDAMRGNLNSYEIDPNTGYTMNTGLMDAATNMAGVVSVGGSHIPRPSNSLGVFGGISAKTANLKTLAQAEAMDAAGVSRAAVWRDTGWIKGSDGKWRFEIDDSAASVAPEFRAADSFERIPLNEALSHDELFQAYPELNQAFAQHRPFPAAAPQGTYGSYVGKSNTVVMNSDAASFLNDARLRSNMLHEVQHAVQRLEGFPAGANTANGMKAYLESPGEIEARAVQMRSKLTPAQRKRVLPNF